MSFKIFTDKIALIAIGGTLLVAGGLGAGVVAAGVIAAGEGAAILGGVARLVPVIATAGPVIANIIDKVRQNQRNNDD